VRTRSRAERRAAALLLVLGLSAAACEQRARPTPAEPDAAVQLTVEVLSPRDGATVVAGRPLAVQVRARDLRGSGVNGVGFVVRRMDQGGGTLDSVAQTLSAPSAETTQAFETVVPAALVTNTHLEVIGLAFGPGSAVRASVPRAVVVARCEPQQPCG
jgi:hypothetical protein